MRNLGLAGFIAVAIVPSAYAEERTYALSGFKTISASAGIETIVTAGDAFSVIAESTPKGLERFDADVSNGVLRLRRIQSGFRIGPADHVVVRVALPSLEALNAASGAKITAAGITASAFSANSASGASIEVTGVCDSITAAASSGAKIDAEQLFCRTASVNSSAGSRVVVHATEVVTASASSGGSISIVGSPENLTQSFSSGGSVRVKG